MSRVTSLVSLGTSRVRIKGGTFLNKVCLIRHALSFSVNNSTMIFKKQIKLAKGLTELLEPEIQQTVAGVATGRINDYSTRARWI